VPVVVLGGNEGLGGEEKRRKEKGEKEKMDLGF